MTLRPLLQSKRGLWWSSTVVSTVRCPHQKFMKSSIHLQYGLTFQEIDMIFSMLSVGIMFQQSQYKSFPSFLEAKLRQRPSDAHKVSQPYGNLTQRRILEADTDGYSLSQSHMKMLVRFRIWYRRIIGINRTSLLFDLFCIFLLVVKRSCKEQQVLHFLLQHWAAAEVLPDYSLSAQTQQFWTRAAIPHYGGHSRKAAWIKSSQNQKRTKTIQTIEFVHQSKLLHLACATFVVLLIIGPNSYGMDTASRLLSCKGPCLHPLCEWKTCTPTQKMQIDNGSKLVSATFRENNGPFTWFTLLFYSSFSEFLPNLAFCHHPLFLRSFRSLVALTPFFARRRKTSLESGERSSSSNRLPSWPRLGWPWQEFSGRGLGLDTFAEKDKPVATSQFQLKWSIMIAL